MGELSTEEARKTFDERQGLISGRFAKDVGQQAPGQIQPQPSEAQPVNLDINTPISGPTAAEPQIPTTQIPTSNFSSETLNQPQTTPPTPESANPLTNQTYPSETPTNTPQPPEQNNVDTNQQSAEEKYVG